MVIKMNEKMAVIIVDSEKDRHDEYIPCIIIEGKQGYFLTDWRWGQGQRRGSEVSEQLQRQTWHK